MEFVIAFLYLIITGVCINSLIKESESENNFVSIMSTLAVITIMVFEIWLVGLGIAVALGW